MRREKVLLLLTAMFQAGPLFLSPMSEIYGRRLILNCATSFFVMFQIGCALAPNLSALIVFRLLTGIGGSACLTIGGGVISDLFEPEQRGLAMSIFSFGPLFGPVLGPICGGFIAHGAGWRWVSNRSTYPLVPRCRVSSIWIYVPISASY
jgi:multidrug resistance protein